MTPEELQSLKSWFFEYSGSFPLSAVEDQRNIALKREHTRLVRLNSRRIAQHLRLGREETMLAEAAALFHDVGRFPQYARYRTFDDSISINHAVLGAHVLLEHDALSELSKQDQGVIIRSVTLHNVFALPTTLDDETALYAKLVRDADKLDILRVFLEFFEQDPGSRAGAVILGLPDEPGCSQEVLRCLRNGTMAKKSLLKTQNDFKLLQLTWMYDLNFTYSLRMVVEQDFITKLAKHLPRTDDITRAVEAVQGYVNGRLKN
jgi:HD superfamily phosphohydrolase YqeK